MNWEKKYKKYEYSQKMKDFRVWCFNNGFLDSGNVISFSKSNIKTIYGFLKCFAETKKAQVYVQYIYHKHYKKADILGMVNSEFRQFDTVEGAMLWCVDKYFSGE